HRQVRLWYSDVRTLSLDCTKFAIYRLIPRDGRWYVVGRSSLPRRIDILGLSRLETVVLTDEPYVIPPRFNLDRFLGLAWAVERSTKRHRVWLRFEPQAAADALDEAWSRG